MNKTLFALFLLAFAAYGQQERVAIINTLDNQDSINFSDLSYLTNRLRETAVNVLPKSKFGVMTTESIVAFLGSQENAIKACKEASCLAELGRKVSADYVSQARIGRFGGLLSINCELYSSKSGTLLGSFTGFSKDIFGLLAIIDENASVLFKKMLVTENVVEVAPPIVTVPQVSEKKIIETETEILVPVESQASEVVKKVVENNSYQNFTTKQRLGTWALNLTINGLGSWLVMGDNVGGLVHLGFGVGTGISFLLYCSDQQESSYILSFGAFLIAGGIFNISHSAFYNKPRGVAHREYEGFNFAVLPDRRGGFVPTVVYSRGF